eukprot:TRINITY_DN11130_c0_g1_i1.p1 TRINITY_DN11130_c0_g1~~TRINITY_DN11130_c0_g1_i1.p1  ORF type:complete len:188 (-),score=29.57 TRINITY_DN11130_c0_g1_i1:66-629(-)
MCFVLWCDSHYITAPCVRGHLGQHLEWGVQHKRLPGDGGKDIITYWFFFFFQAEDGIRDVERSRGLGDVYKRQPKYHTREVAEFISELKRCKLVLGSATPSVESYYKALCGEYRLIELCKRVNGKSMPSMEIVDMREELKSKNLSLFSSCLLYTSDAADDTPCVDLGGRRIIKKKKTINSKDLNTII